MGEKDYGTISMIAGERSDIGMTVSSTPTGKRGTFYKMCTDRKMGYIEHYHPSMDSPAWDDKLEAQFRAELTSAEYDHEVLAIFGTEEAGVFNKDKLDIAFSTWDYTYRELDRLEIEKAREENRNPRLFMWEKKAPANVYRTMGVDWDKVQAGSSIVILDYDVNTDKFVVILRLEVPRSEYSYDVAVKTIIQLNDKYNPTWIFADKGSGEAQIEQLHLYGEKNTASGLREKLIGWQFKNKVDVIDPVTREMDKKPMKPFMVNQLTIALERERMILSPYDNTMRKQMTNYVVERVSQNGDPVYSSKDEHSIDALGLSYLAMVLKFPKIARQVTTPEFTAKVYTSERNFSEKAMAAIQLSETPGSYSKNDLLKKIDTSEPRGERANYVKIPLGYNAKKSGNFSWGSRNSFTRRTTW